MHQGIILKIGRSNISVSVFDVLGDNNERKFSEELQVGKSYFFQRVES